MRDDSVRTAMLVIAALTPLLGALAWFIGGGMNRAARDAGTELPLNRLGLKCLVLALAGPANLALWHLFNGWLNRIGYRSVLGYALAALVFLLGGWLTGWLSRRKAR